MNKDSYIKSSLIGIIPVAVLVLLLLGLLLSLSLDVVFAYQVPELPPDNLIVNPWFRSTANRTEPGFDGWTRPLNEGVTWGPSQKESNPSPDIVITGRCGNEPVYCGTAARWAEQFGVLYPNIDVYAYQIVAADPSHRNLKFFTYYVSHLVDVGEVNVYGSDSQGGPWEIVWVPLYHTQDQLIVPESGEIRDLWLETGFIERNLERGYNFYKIELHSRLPESPHGIRGVGFKITGIYFSTSETSEPGQPLPTSIPLSTPPPGIENNREIMPTLTVTATAEVGVIGSTIPSATLPSPLPETTSVAQADESNDSGTYPDLMVEALSASEILITWDESQNNSRGFRLERSKNGMDDWNSIASVGPNAGAFTDSGLIPETVVYYRLRGSQDSTSNLVSVSTLPEPKLFAPSSLQILAGTQSQLELSWIDNSDDENGFVIERSVDGVSFTRLATVNQNIATFEDIGLGPGTYYYRVQSFRNDTYSDYSDIVSVTLNDFNLEQNLEGAQESEPSSAGEEGTAEQSNQSGLLDEINLIVPVVAISILAGVGLLIIGIGRKS